MKIKLVPLMHRDKNKCPGIKRSHDVPILVKWNDRELWKVPGGHYYNRGKHTVPGYIVLVAESDREWLRAHSQGRIEIAKTARLSKKLLLVEKAKEIEKFFGGAKVAHLIRPDMTVLIEDEAQS